jgi:DNA-binding XRE family transcriptional regulator
MPFRKVLQEETEAELRKLSSADPENAAYIDQSMADAKLKHLLHAAREEAGLSQKELGKAVGLSQQAVCRIEKQGTNVTLNSIIRYLSGTGKKLHISIK